MFNEAVKYEKKGVISILTLNRPTDANLVDAQLAEELRESFRKVQDDDSVRALIVTGNGQSFCGGSRFDIKTLIAEGTSPQDIKEKLMRHRITAELSNLKIPVIAAINGDAIGQGLELALACDIRLASDSVRMGLNQIISGLIPWDGGTQRLPRLIGKSIATFLIVLGESIDAAEALRIGLVHHVFHRRSLMQQSLRIAEKIASQAPIAVAYAKEAINKGMEMPLDHALHLEEDLSLILQSTDDRREGISAFLNKRPPGFQGT